MKNVKLLIMTFMITVLIGTSGVYAIADSQSTVEAKSKYCNIKKCTKDYKHKHKVCPKKNCTKTKVHKHNKTYYKGHKRNDGHKYHSNCQYDECKKLNKHSHKHDGSGNGNGNGHHGGHHGC